MSDAQHAEKQAELQSLKERTFHKMKNAPLLSSVARVCGMLGGPLWATGLLAIVGVGSVAAPIAIGMTIVGGLLSLASIAIDYRSTRKMQDSGFDQMELGCKTSAHNLVKELKANGMSFAPAAEFNNPPRADGRTWENVVSTPNTAMSKTV